MPKPKPTFKWEDIEKFHPVAQKLKSKKTQAAPGDILGIKFTREQFEDALGIAPRTARDRLRKLEKAGIVQGCGDFGSRCCHYLCVQRPLPQEFNPMFPLNDEGHNVVDQPGELDGKHGVFQWPLKGLPGWVR